MLSLLAFAAPLLALWLWLPLWRAPRRRLVLALGLTTLVGIAPFLLILAMRHAWLPLAWVTHLQLLSGALFAALCLGMLTAALRDALWLGLRLSGRPQAAARCQQPRWTVVALALWLLLSAYGVVQGTRVPEVRTQHIALPRLPTELVGLRIGVLADLHATPVNNAAYVRAVVERLNAAQPDLVVLPGDLVDGDAATQAGNLAPLADLRAPAGVWAAPGNHEYYSGYDAWAAVYRRLNLHYLANEAQAVSIAERQVVISGVGDPAYGRLSEHNTDPRVPEGVPPDIREVAAQAQALQPDLHILLGHQPKMARSYAPWGVDLQIAGHTHGGHVRGMDRWLVAPANDGFVRGLYQVGSMRLFVSSGAGLWPGFALRLGVPPAIDLLVLEQADNQADGAE